MGSVTEQQVPVPLGAALLCPAVVSASETGGATTPFSWPHVSSPLLWGTGRPEETPWGVHGSQQQLT